MYLLYSFAIVLFFVVVSPYFVYQALRYRKYVGSLPQRLGVLPVSLNLDGDASIWIHAVSVGEVLTARPLISDLKRRYPNLRMFLSTTTMAGQQLARRNVQDVDAVFYFPFDLGLVVRRTLDLVRPRLFIMMETEIWPNLLRECRERGIKTAVVNGRLSARSFPRYRMVRPLMRRVLDHIDRFLVQSEESARRFIDLGADPGRVVVTGSLKFDSLDLSSTASQARSRDRVLRYFRVPASRPVIVAGCSTIAMYPRLGKSGSERDGIRSMMVPASGARTGVPHGATISTPTWVRLPLDGYVPCRYCPKWLPGTRARTLAAWLSAIAPGAHNPAARKNGRNPSRNSTGPANGR